MVVELGEIGSWFGWSLINVEMWKCENVEMKNLSEQKHPFAFNRLISTFPHFHISTFLTFIQINHQ